MRRRQRRHGWRRWQKIEIEIEICFPFYCGDTKRVSLANSRGDGGGGGGGRGGGGGGGGGDGGGGKGDRDGKKIPFFKSFFLISWG